MSKGVAVGSPGGGDGDERPTAGVGWPSAFRSSLSLEALNVEHRPSARWATFLGDTGPADEAPWGGVRDGAQRKVGVARGAWREAGRRCPGSPLLADFRPAEPRRQWSQGASALPLALCLGGCAE